MGPDDIAKAGAVVVGILALLAVIFGFLLKWQQKQREKSTPVADTGVFDAVRCAEHKAALDQCMKDKEDQWKAINELREHRTNDVAAVAGIQAELKAVNGKLDTLILIAQGRFIDHGSRPDLPRV